MDGVWIDSIVTFLNNNFNIEKKSKDYTVLFPSTNMIYSKFEKKDLYEYS